MSDWDYERTLDNNTTGLFQHIVPVDQIIYMKEDWLLSLNINGALWNLKQQFMLADSVSKLTLAPC